MNRRFFSFHLAQKAADYAAFLQGQAIEHEIMVADGYVTISTPAELAPHNFPNPKDLRGCAPGGGRFSDDPDNHCGKWARR